mmetsp:Transcript_13557/g.21655  ORF Transcript_13557/g.21655 Transcript_13557/m.21655 type:complete len:274 (+) Transcript_13557:4607-5428(+)
MDKPVHPVMLGRWLQVLANGQKIDIGGAHIFHDLHDSLTIFTEAHHDPRFGKHGRVEFLDPLQETQAVEIPRARPHFGVKPRHSFEVVVKHVWARLNNDLQHTGITSNEIRRQNFDGCVGAAVPDGANSLGKVISAAVLHVIAIHRRDHHVVQAQFFHRKGHAPRFKRIQVLGRLARRDIAKGAGAGADFAHDHHGRVALAPAFADIGAPRLFADGHQLVFAHDLGGLGIAFAAGCLDPDPVGLFRLRIVRASGLFRVAFGGNFQVAHAGASR